MGNQSINKCNWCELDYCSECSKHEHWGTHCSEKCYEEEAEEEKTIQEQAKLLRIAKLDAWENKN